LINKMFREICTLPFIRMGVRGKILSWFYPTDVERSNFFFVVPFRGMKLTGNLRNEQDFVIYFLGAYENAELCTLYEVAKAISGCTAFDIGANMGQHTLVLSSAAAQVFAFEPLPEMRTIAQRRIVENGLTNVEFLPFGLAAADETLTYYWDPASANSSVGSFLPEHGAREPHAQLQVRNGDNWVAERSLARVDLLKIDVEGFEVEVVIGLRDTLARHEPVVLIEISESSFDKLETAGGLGAVIPFSYDLYEVREASNLIVFRFAPYRLRPFETLRRPAPIGFNVLIVPKSRTGLQRLIAARVE